MCTVGRVFLVAVLLLPFMSRDRLDVVQVKRRGVSMVGAATSTVTTKKIKDVQPGEVIQIGSTKFVKIAANRYQAITPYTCADPVLTYAGAVKNFDYTGSEQTFTAYAGCQYKLEVWGAAGGGCDSQSSSSHRGLGGYSYGELYTQSTATLYVFVGEQGGTRGNGLIGGWNGGGNGNRFTARVDNDNENGHGGGGMTHISLTNNLATTSWNPDGTLIVAGAGAGADNLQCGLSSDDGSGGYGGGSNAGNGYQEGSLYGNSAGTQISGYKQGVGDPAPSYNGGYDYGGAGAGWYGGYSVCRYTGPANCGGAGGSGWIYTAATYSYWKANGAGASGVNWTVPTTFYLQNAATIAGNASFPTPHGDSETGHAGHGYARITRLN